MRRLGIPAAVVVGVAVAVRLVFPADYLNYDARYALLWARDVLHGVTPDFTAPFAPTPHPLSTLWSVPAALAGQNGDQLIAWGTLLAFGLVILLTFRLGAELFSPAVGFVTALVVLTRPAYLRDAVLGYQDVPFAALVLGAALLEARRPRRGAPVLGLLALAGLLRPEAWVLAGIYWLYAGRPVRLLALVAVAPALWALSDLAVTGDALHALHGTAALARAVGRRRDLADAPYWTAKYYGFALREPLALGVPIGLAFALRHRRRAAVLLLATAGAMTLVFALGPVFGLPLIARYIRTPAVFMAIFFGVAVAGWRLIEHERRPWQALALLSVAVFVAFIPLNVRQLRSARTGLERREPLYAALERAGHDPGLRALARRCGLRASDRSAVAHLRYWLGTDPGSVAVGTGGRVVARGRFGTLSTEC